MKWHIVLSVNIGASGGGARARACVECGELLAGRVRSRVRPRHRLDQSGVRAVLVFLVQSLARDVQSVAVFATHLCILPPLAIAFMALKVSSQIECAGNESAYHEGIRRATISHAPVVVGGSVLDSAAFTSFIDPYRSNRAFWKGFQLMMRLLLVGGTQLLHNTTDQAKWATCVTFIAFTSGATLRPFAGHGLELAILEHRICAMPWLQHEGLLSMGTDFTLFVNSATGVALLQGYLQAKTAMLWLVPCNVMVLAMLAGLQAWRQLAQSLYDNWIVAMQAPQMREAVKRVVKHGKTDTEVAEQVIKWVHSQHWRSRAQQRKVCVAPQVTLLDWPAVDTLLHLASVHRRWRAMRDLLDHVNMCFELDDAAMCCALLSRENADGKTLLGLLLEEPTSSDGLEEVWNVRRRGPGGGCAVRCLHDADGDGRAWCCALWAGWCGREVQLQGAARSRANSGGERRRGRLHRESPLDSRAAGAGMVGVYLCDCVGRVWLWALRAPVGCAAAGTAWLLSCGGRGHGGRVRGGCCRDAAPREQLVPTSVTERSSQ